MVHNPVVLQVQFRTGDYVEEFGSDNVVFLTSESPNILNGM